MLLYPAWTRSVFCKLALTIAYAIVLVHASPATPNAGCSLYDSDSTSARQLMRQGRYSEAADILRPLIDQQTRIHQQKQDCDLASALNNLALSYQKMGRYREAEPLYLQSVKRFEERNDPTHIAVLTNLATLYADRGEISKAKKIALRIQTFPIRSGPEYAHTLHVLGNIAAKSDEYAQAEQLLRQALALFKAAGATEAIEFALLLNDLAGVRLEFNELREVEEYLDRAVRILEQKAGPEHPLLISALVNFADLQWQRNRPAEAAALMERALRISRHALGHDHVTTGEMLGDYSVILRRLGRNSEAREAENSARLIAKAHNQENLGGHTVEMRDLIRRRRLR